MILINLQGNIPSRKISKIYSEYGLILYYYFNSGSFYIISFKNLTRLSFCDLLYSLTCYFYDYKLETLFINYGF